jgi:lipopolysaccharide exporter
VAKENPPLHGQIARGLAWSSVNSIVLRMGSFVVGIVLARLLAPEQFGVFAVALAVQAVLMAVADLGMSTDLIRSESPREKAPTVATLALGAGALLALSMALSAQGLADLLGSPEAGPVIAVMSIALFLAGAGVVPFAALQRSFAQKKLFGIALADFVVGTTITILLILLGWGVMALAVGRLVAQCMVLVLQFVLSGEKFRLGFDRKLAPSILAFGVPVAGANMLSWALLNVDSIAISRFAGATALGFYYLAFNVSNWPMSVIGQVVRSVSIPAFAQLRSSGTDRSFSTALGPVWAVGLLAGLMIAVLAGPLINILYGPRWAQAAAVLVWLGLFGALRTVFDLAASFLLARGASRVTFMVQVIWIVTLIPAILLGVNVGGIVGVGIAHLAVAFLVVCPAYGVALARQGVDLRATLHAVWPPIVAALPAGAVAAVLLAVIPSAVGGFFAAGVAGTLVYGLALSRWLPRRVTQLRQWASAGRVPIVPAAENISSIVVQPGKGTP